MRSYSSVAGTFLNLTRICLKVNRLNDECPFRDEESVRFDTITGAGRIIKFLWSMCF